MSGRTWLKVSAGLQSTDMSMRATKKCWWAGAYSPGAIVVPYFLDSPCCSAPRLRIPVSLTSASILPSCVHKGQYLAGAYLKGKKSNRVAGRQSMDFNCDSERNFKGANGWMIHVIDSEWIFFLFKHY